MENTELLLIVSIIILAALSLGLFAYALYYRWQTELRKRLVARKSPQWQRLIKGWLEEGKLYYTREDLPEEFLQYLNRESEQYNREDRRKLGELVEAMGLVRKMRQLISVQDPMLKAWAIHVAGYLEIQQLREDISSYQTHEIPLVAYAANLSMARMLTSDQPEFYALLHKLVARFDQWTTEKLGDIVILMGPEAGKELLRLAESGYAQGKLLWFIIDVAGEMSLPEATDVLLTLLGMQRETVVHAIRALGQISDPGAMRPISFLLGHPDWIVRAQAAKVLGSFKNPFVVPSLQKAMQDKVWWVRHNAALSLMTIGGEGTAALREIAATSQDRYAVDMATFTLREQR